jgi:hypothetical protein
MLKRNDIDRAREVLRNLDELSKSADKTFQRMLELQNDLNLICQANPDISYTLSRELRFFKEIKAMLRGWNLPTLMKRMLVEEEDNLYHDTSSNSRKVSKTLDSVGKTLSDAKKSLNNLM